MASPPHVPQLNIPRKRSSVSSVTSAAKKRKPSQLRNSFAPESEAAGLPLRYSRSPSLDSGATGSVANGAGGRKRKRKDGDTQSVTGSVRGGKARSTAAGTEGEGAEGGDGAQGAEGAEEEDDDDDLEEEMAAVLEGGSSTEASRKQAKEHERMLTEAMDTDQSNRYDTYRRVRLKRETVRKLVNQTLSQSVPGPVVIAVSSYTKAFIGELIDGALTVRDEWAATRTHLPNPNLPPALIKYGLNAPKAHRPDAMPSETDLQNVVGYVTPQIRNEPYWKEVGENVPLQDRLKMCDKGPLTPAHMREALRRYKRDREGGGAGFAGMSLEGVERTLGRTGGRKLFR
ncbi:TAFII28-domain-containing protein [Lophiostoma macrostomum CBS 122681]|uniref:TAFII28-domain-containing protein n=1 Tax=Lophiostoma macrostomum CBS 122681 TaxID=1314788 RepID=A0A6A6SNZ7_9PLEO|nr:TAFII28-domain-containing protein [Lophiostoma macrostomum CBS 122681]